MVSRTDAFGIVSWVMQFVGLAMSLALFSFAAWLFCASTPCQSTAESDVVAEVCHGE